MIERKIIMKMKKIICAAVCAAVMCTSAAAFTSCSKSGDEGSSDSAAAVQTDVTKDVVAIADKLKSDIAFVDSLNELSPEMVEKLIGVAQDQYTAGKVYVGSGGATAEEIACFEANDASAAETIAAALQKRVESQKKAFENYQPKEMDKLNTAVIKLQGKYVFMCISDENDKAEEIIG